MICHEDPMKVFNENVSTELQQGMLESQESGKAKRPGCLISLPLMPYQQAWALQRSILDQRIYDHCSDTLLVVEHEPVFTMGRTTKEEHWKRDVTWIKDQNFGVHTIERGGSVTYHGPGQIICYPIVRLRNYCKGPKAYVGMLQDVILRVLAEWNIHGSLRDKFPGVWVEGMGFPLTKVAAIGVRIMRGVTMHGLSLNVNLDLKPFDLITPCGIDGCRVTSMEQLLEGTVDSQVVREQLVYHFAEVFGFEWTECHTSIQVGRTDRS